MTSSFWILTICFIVISIYILWKVRKQNSKILKIGAYSLIAFLFFAYLFFFYKNPYLVDNKMIISKYTNIDKNEILYYKLVSDNRDEKFYNKVFVDTNKIMIEKLCNELKKINQFYNTEAPNVFKVYRCKIIFKNGDSIYFPIKISEKYGSYIEIYERGGMIEEQLGNFRNDSLNSFLSDFYFPEKLDFEYKEGKFDIFNE